MFKLVIADPLTVTIRTINATCSFVFIWPFCNIRVRSFRLLLITQERLGLIKSFIKLAVLRQCVERVCRAHLRVIAPDNTVPFEEQSQPWRAVGNSVFDLTGLSFKSQTSRSRDELVITKFRQRLKIIMMVVCTKFRGNKLFAFAFNARNLLRKFGKKTASSKNDISSANNFTRFISEDTFSNLPT